MLRLRVKSRAAAEYPVTSANNCDSTLVAAHLRYSKSNLSNMHHTNSHTYEFDGVTKRAVLPAVSA
jgi:hypothetical protein